MTGGGRSIGWALGLAQSGADVAIVYRERVDAAEATAASARQHGIRALAVQADTSDESQAQRMVERVTGEFGGVEILVNNAGVQSRIPLLKLLYDEWRRILQTNLDGYFLVGQAMARQMVAAGHGGAIFNIMSSGQDSVALKLTIQMAYELALHGIRVNALAPGLTETDINRDDLADPTCRSQRLSRIPLGFIGTPEDQVGAAYDAGTERNNQLWSSMPAGCNALGPSPRDPDGQNDRDLTDEPITMHPGIGPGVGDLGTEFAWSDPVVKITVQLVE